jgi:hypothetical protein
MFGMGANEILTFGIGIALIYFGILGLLIPLLVYRISINIAGMRETMDAMHGMIQDHIESERDRAANLDDLLPDM